MWRKLDDARKTILAYLLVLCVLLNVRWNTQEILEGCQ
nr:MAG TPA: hypothetical protein [Caudoviricetes sp.]